MTKALLLKGSPGCSAVSYTHLDVYKRQGHHSLPGLLRIHDVYMWLTRRAFERGELAIDQGDRHEMSGPVSYTHLDVYKRQALAVPSSACSARPPACSLHWAVSW